MRVAYVVQRYGREIAGGAEQHCREMAERLHGRGHEVRVLTTCASSYVDWANAYEPGETILNGVIVHRFLVDQTRDNDAFNVRTEVMLSTPELRSLEAQREWLRMQGPHAPALAEWLRTHAADFDCVVVFTFLYWTTWQGLRVASGVCPTVLHPTVHDEPGLHFSIFDQLFRLPDVFAFSTQEEIDLVARRFHLSPRGEIVGIGVELERASGTQFREQWPVIGDAPYILYVGRVDEGKGAGALYRDFVRYKRDHPGDLKLVFLGERIATFPEHPDVLLTGFVDYDVRDSALAGSLALVQPSSFESFSMILTEAFAQGRPALVQARSAVLVGHAARSGAAIPYGDADEFARSLHELVTDPIRADRLGARGRAYVAEHYAWDVVMDRYERLLFDVAHRR